jgi:hypothetical protein
VPVEEVAALVGEDGAPGHVHEVLDLQVLDNRKDRGLEAPDPCGLLVLRRQIAADPAPNPDSGQDEGEDDEEAPSLKSLVFTGPEPMRASDRPENTLARSRSAAHLPAARPGRRLDRVSGHS